MIVLKNLEAVIDEERSLPLQSGGELENYLAPIVANFLLQNFGIKCEVALKD